MNILPKYRVSKFGSLLKFSPKLVAPASSISFETILYIRILSTYTNLLFVNFPYILIAW